eukprot:COSAG01_NODE_54718_length_330_cov_0.727273_1_plen_40_part_01
MSSAGSSSESDVATEGEGVVARVCLLFVGAAAFPCSYRQL